MPYFARGVVFTKFQQTEDQVIPAILSSSLFELFLQAHGEANAFMALNCFLDFMDPYQFSPSSIRLGDVDMNMQLFTLPPYRISPGRYLVDSDVSAGYRSLQRSLDPHIV